MSYSFHKSFCSEAFVAERCFSVLSFFIGIGANPKLKRMHKVYRTVQAVLQWRSARTDWASCACLSVRRLERYWSAVFLFGGDGGCARVCRERVCTRVQNMHHMFLRLQEEVSTHVYWKLCVASFWEEGNCESVWFAAVRHEFRGIGRGTEGKVAH